MEEEEEKWRGLGKKRGRRRVGRGNRVKEEGRLYLSMM